MSEEKHEQQLEELKKVFEKHKDVFIRLKDK